VPVHPLWFNGFVRDRLTKERRSWNMSRIRGQDTTPEKRVRSLLHRMGHRFRLHVRIPVTLAPSMPLAHRMGEGSRVRAREGSGVRCRAPSTKHVRPDLVLVKHRIAVFVHGCFWHRHRGCKNCTTPTHNRAFWVKKLEGNAARDKVHQRALYKLGWRTLVVWECETEKLKNLERIMHRLAKLPGVR